MDDKIIIYTSYFAKYKWVEYSVNISLYPPKGWDIADVKHNYPQLFPTSEILWEWKNSNQDEEAWQRYKFRYFSEVLSKLDANKVAKDLNGMVLLCYESPIDAHCHRHLIAQWLEKKVPNCMVREVEY